MREMVGRRTGSWLEGKVIAGFFIEAREFPNCESRILTFDFDGKSTIVSCWETAALMRIVEEMVVGKYYLIECLGKKETAKGQMAWSFKTWQMTEDSEVKQAIERFREKVIGQEPQTATSLDTPF